MPFLLGHEAAGVVEEVGAGVESVADRDLVILNWRAVCGQCRACKRGRPPYCFDTHNAKQKTTLIDFFSRGGALKSSRYGDCLPEGDFPMLAELYQWGRLPLERFVSARIKLDEVEDAFHTMHEGAVPRSVVVL